MITADGADLVASRCGDEWGRERADGGLPGVWGGALFLVLLLTMLNTFGVSAGVRLLLTGLIIVAVITAAGGEKATR